LASLARKPGRSDRNAWYSDLPGHSLEPCEREHELAGAAAELWVPDLTSSFNIKLNKRVSLQCHPAGLLILH
jgi:hypothetical protein